MNRTQNNPTPEPGTATVAPYHVTETILVRERIRAAAAARESLERAQRRQERREAAARRDRRQSQYDY